MYINIYSFSKSGIQCFWQGEISICKVLVPIKVVPRKNDYSNYIDSKWMGFCIGAVFTEKNLSRIIVTCSLPG